MRSRTELVTTTFDLDSDEEDYSPDDDDSEEDWRPNKKPQQKPRGIGNSSSEAGGGRKRKASATHASKTKKRATVAKINEDDFESADDYDDDVETEPSDEDFDCPTAASTSGSKRSQSLPPKKQFVKLAQLDLLLKKRDLLSKDWLDNKSLCLWRKDEQTNLLQKYLRVKTLQDAAKPKEQQLLFTSSSVYSSWDEQRIRDFIDVKVNCLDPNNRRIQLDDIEAIKRLSLELQAINTLDGSDNNDDSSDQEPTALESEQDEDQAVDDDNDDDDEEPIVA